jgi:hypothetical protein
MIQIIENIKIGSKITFQEEKQSYKVMAFDHRYLICIKPFNLKQTYLYSIVDLEKGIRGADNYYGKFNYEDYDECIEAIIELHTGEMGLSYRNWCKLNVKMIRK